MSKKDKLIAKLLAATTEFKWSDLEALLKLLGYEKLEGKGSRVKFDNGRPGDMINLHKPHPQKEIKAYAVKQVKEKLVEAELI